MMRQTEIPEKKGTQYDPVWVDSKVDLLLGIMAAKIPQLGLYMASHMNKDKEYVRGLVVRYFTDMHAFAFSQIKNVVRNTMTQENHDFSRESIKKIVVDLEKEFGAALPELGIESDTTIDAFVLNQCRWFSTNFRFKETA